MEYNNQNFEQEPDILREKGSSSKSVWYWIIALLILVLALWYGFTSGLFSQNTKSNDFIDVPMDNGIGSINDVTNDPMAPIDNMVISTLQSFPVQKVLIVRGNLLNGCMYLNDTQVIRDGNVFYVSLTVREEGDTCTEALVPYERNIALDVVGLPAGVYTVIVNDIETSFELEQDNTLDFSGGMDK